MTGAYAFERPAAHSAVSAALESRGWSRVQETVTLDQVDAGAPAPDPHLDAGLPGGVPIAPPPPGTTAPPPTVPPPPPPPPTVTLPAHIRGDPSPAGTPDRIPPRVSTAVAVGIAGTVPAGSPVTLSIDGGGGGNGTATIDGHATSDLLAAGTVQLRGVDQTDAGNAGNLHLVASQGTTRLATSPGFSVAAWPVQVDFRFHAILSPMLLDGSSFWGASYDVVVTSDSGVTGDLGLTKISENVIAHVKTGIFASSIDRQSNFLRTTASQRDHHATGDADAATMITSIDAAGAAARSHAEFHQLFRFACQRSGVAEDRAAGPKVKTSGFKILQAAAKTGRTYFINVSKNGFANNGVLAGTVNDGAVKAAEVKD